MEGLGGCPVAVTVYPPGRGCLHSARLYTKSRLRRVFLREATISAGHTVYPRKTPSSPRKEQTTGTLTNRVAFRMNFSGARSAVEACLFQSPSPSKEKSASPLRKNTSALVHARHCRGEVEMAACCRRGHTAAEWLLLRR